MNAPFLRRQLGWFLEEDLGHVDIDERTTLGTAPVKASIIAEEPGVLCGARFLPMLFDLLSDPTSALRPKAAPEIGEGASFEAGVTLAKLEMHPELLRHGIRTALNLVQHLSGIATNTERLARIVAPTGCVLLDSRKTTPGLRVLEKYAVRTGGGRNHRFNRADGILLKKEDIAIDRSVRGAVDRIWRNVAHLTAIEVEVETFDELEEVMKDDRVSHVLLDNMEPDDIRKAVLRVGGAKIVEASGVTESRLLEYAQTGVPFISTSALVRSARALKARMRIITA